MGLAREAEFKRRQIFDPSLRHQVLILQSNSAVDFGAVESRFDGEDLSDFQDVVPLRVDVRKLVWLKADAVAEVVAEGFAAFVKEVLFAELEEVAAADAG